LSPPPPAYIAGEGMKKMQGAKKARRRVLVNPASGAIAAMAAFAIAGCAGGASSAPVARPLMVRVPVLHETPCPAPALTEPTLPIAALKAASAPADTMRAYAAAVAILKGAVRERDAVLAGCARADHSTSGPTPAATPPIGAQAESMP
jgi:hypothetical protein